MLDSPSIDLLEELDLDKSANFAEEESCQAIVDLLAQATNLRMCNIEYHQGHQGRKVRITVECKSEEGEEGQICLTDTDTEAVFTQKTTRTEECFVIHNYEEFDQWEEQEEERLAAEEAKKEKEEERKK